MKRLVIISTMSLFVLASCSKTDKPIVESNATTQSDMQTCDFGITSFNLNKRAPGSEDNGVGANRGNTVTTTALPTTTGVILLDFDGQTISGTNWNLGQTFTVAPANLSSAAVYSILQRMSIDYAPFNVIVTTEESLYNSALANKRMRVIFTETWEWFGQAGGTSFKNSFTWGNNTPCFVFSSLLNYNEKQIAEAASHEVGHTLGLNHQSTYNNGVLVSQYNYGQGTGEIGWAPIMGCSYYQNLSTWHNGPSNVGANIIQNDITIIAGKLPLKADDFGNTIALASPITSGAKGSLSSSTDVDFFSVTLTNSASLTVTPKSLGGANVGAEEDLIVKIYDASGNLISTISDPSVLNAGGTLNPGTYYISVGSEANQYATTYGMLGEYTLSLN